MMAKLTQRNNSMDQAQAAVQYCIKHPEEEIDMYCKKCRDSTCTECLKTDHAGHDFATILKSSKKIKNKRQDLIRELEDMMSLKREQNENHVLGIKIQNANVLKSNVENVEKKREEMLDAVEKISNENADSLKSHNTCLNTEIYKKEVAFELEERQLKEMINNFRKTTMSGLDLIKYYDDLKARVGALKPIEIAQYSDKQMFEEGELNPDDMKTMIGQVRLEDGTTIARRPEMLSKFQCKRSNLHSLCPISRDEAWIAFDKSHEFILLRRDGSKIESVKKNGTGHSFIIHDNSFLLCNQDEQQKNILKIDMSGKTSTWAKVSPLLPRYIGHALNGNILISLVDEMSDSKTDKSRRIVQMLTPNGEVCHTYEFDVDGTTPALTFPKRVTQNYNSDVCVGNEYKVVTHKFDGNVCVFNENGGLKFKYKGQGGVFIPDGICCDTRCNIICTNYVNNTVHVVNGEGSFVQYLLQHDICISYPLSLALQRVFCGLGPRKVKYGRTDTRVQLTVGFVYIKDYLTLLIQFFVSTDIL